MRFSLVLQGPVHARSERLAEHCRRHFPKSQIIISTWEPSTSRGQDLLDSGTIDRLIINDDPGALPPTVKSPTARENNLNRMIVSSRAGIEACDEDIVLRVRSDAWVDPLAALQTWQGYGGLADGRLLFASRYSRHPFGVNGYLFHLSDWITLGRRADCLAYWSAPLMRAEEATRFDHSPCPVNRPNARRWRALMSQEQWLCAHWARSLGYPTISHLADRRPEMIESCLRFLAEKAIVADASTLGLYLPKHAKAQRSLFQKIDCISESEWVKIKTSQGNAAPLWRKLLQPSRDVLLRLIFAKKAARQFFFVERSASC